jgi:hypothetical protein
MIGRALIVAAALAVGVGEAAASSCYQPSAPYCASGYGPFSDESEFDSCKSEMDSYQSETDDFLSCLKRESDDAIREYNDAVEAFNRRARG